MHYLHYVTQSANENTQSQPISIEQILRERSGCGDEFSDVILKSAECYVRTSYHTHSFFETLKRNTIKLNDFFSLLYIFLCCTDRAPPIKKHINSYIDTYIEFGFVKSKTKDFE